MNQNLPQNQQNKQMQVSPVNRLKEVMATPSVQEQFRNAMAENSNLFVASLIDLYASDNYLQQCNPAQVVAEALKAATLKLPINKSLGFAYIVPYQKSIKVSDGKGGDKWEKRQIPQFQLGYKGMVQLAMRTGQYRYLNDGVVYEGEFKGHNKLTGELDLSGAKKSDEVVGYFSHIETVNGFKKTLYCSKDDMLKHAKKYSKSFDQAKSPWQTEFDSMARKTMLRMLLGKYGIMSVDMAEGMAGDEDHLDYEEEYRANANSQVIDIETSPLGVNTTTGEITTTETSGPSSADIDAQLAAQDGQEEDPYA